MDRLIHPKNKTAAISRRERLPQSPAALTVNCVVLQKGFAPLQHAFALPQNPGGIFRNGGAMLPKNFAPVQDTVAAVQRAFAPFTCDFAVLQNHFARLQTGFLPQKNHCGNPKTFNRSTIFDDLTLNAQPTTTNYPLCITNQQTNQFQ